MVKANYNKPQIDVCHQIQLLKGKGLNFVNENHARHLLENISYYRMKAYLRPLRKIDRSMFRTGSTFEQAYALYKFDSELRQMVFAELKKIEISVRTRLSYALTDAYGIYWFADSTHFKSASKHAAILDKVSHELSRSDEDSILSFFCDYSNPYPPSWMTMEVTSFGTMSMLYSCLSGGSTKRNVSRTYGLSDTVFESWLHSIVYIRNICAHHGRLWNRTLRIRPLTPRRTHQPFLSMPADPQRLFYVLSIIVYLLQSVNPNSTFVNRFKDLLKRYPNVDVTAMGFPCDWENELLWQS